MKYAESSWLAELMDDGEIIAVADAETGVEYKRVEVASVEEKTSVLTLTEVKVQEEEKTDLYNVYVCPACSAKIPSWYTHVCA